MIFNRKESLSDRVESIERELKYIEKRLTQSECSHKNIEFVDEYGRLVNYRGLSPFVWVYTYKKCIECGKTLGAYTNKTDFLKAKAEHHAHLAAEANKELDLAIKEADGEDA